MTNAGLPFPVALLCAAGLSAAVRSYQQVATLTTGELWAFPTLLRLATVKALNG